jgi:hypothetical protein
MKFMDWLMSGKPWLDLRELRSPAAVEAARLHHRSDVTRHLH